MRKKWFELFTGGCSLGILGACAMAAVLVAAGALHPAVWARPTVTQDTSAILVLGDSLSAEYGIARGSGWVALLAQKLQADNQAYAVINASVSGETSSGGLARLPRLLSQHRPKIVIIELGGNDGLRGLGIAQTLDNFRQMVAQSTQAHAQVLLLGMQLPPNLGQRYSEDFSAMYRAVARMPNVRLVPFWLKGIADAPNAAEWFQPDRIHPLASAHPRLLGNVYPELKKLLRQSQPAL